MLGRAMDFWEENMPRGMLLRSACDWHLDPAEEHTIERYLNENGRTPDAVDLGCRTPHADARGMAV